jgi:hypothetical protein
MNSYGDGGMLNDECWIKNYECRMMSYDLRACGGDCITFIGDMYSKH